MNLTADEKKEITKCRLENASEMAGGGCGVCERKGFPLLLVRKAIAKPATHSNMIKAHRWPSLTSTPFIVPLS